MSKRSSTGQRSVPLGLRVCEAEFAVLFGVWLGFCFVAAPPAWAIAMWVPLFLAFAFDAGKDNTIR
jgi:hypothetical protein